VDETGTGRHLLVIADETRSPAGPRVQAAFAVQLIAATRGLDTQRARRRAAPAEAGRAYGGAQSAPAERKKLDRVA
jgi:hypothetical protein